MRTFALILLQSKELDLYMMCVQYNIVCIGWNADEQIVCMSVRASAGGVGVCGEKYID